MTMSIPDGEYDIDLTILNDDTASERSFAIRYGFVPDSMDQSKPITLYQAGQELILKASSIDKDGSIIFEGIGRGATHGNGASANASSTYSDSFFLSYHDGGVKLNKLNNTIRVNKSRNMAKWSSKIEEWNKIEPKAVEIPTISLNRTSASSSSSRQPNSRPASRPTPTPKSLPATPAITPTQKNAQRNLTVAAPPKRASKRPASKRPPKKESPIISESDFDDLEEDTEFPEFSFEQELNRELAESSKKEEPPKKKKMDRISTPTIPVPAAPETADVSNADDDFKDLEDQLQEVLGDDDDDDSDDDGYRFGGGAPITIEVDEGDRPQKNTPKFSIGSFNEKKKPMSLNELMGGDVSSEEE